MNPQTRHPAAARLHAPAPPWLSLLPPGAQALLVFAAAAAVLWGWLAMLSANHQTQWPARPTLQVLAMWLAVPLLCALASLATDEARRRIALWRQRRVPGLGVQQTLRSWHRLMLVLLAVTLLPMLLTAALHRLDPHHLAGDLRLLREPLLTLHYAGLALLASAGWRGLLPAGWMLALLLLLLEWALRLARVWDPGPAQALLQAAGLAFTLPLAWYLCARQLRALPTTLAAATGRSWAPPAGPPAARDGLALLRRDLARRWQALDPGTTSISGSLFWMLLVMPSLAGTGTASVLPGWGSDVNALQLLRPLCLCLLVTPLLRCPGLHWRQLLAPGGTSRQRLGWQILRASLVGVGLATTLALAFPLALLACTQAWFGLGLAASVWAELPGAVAALLPELVLATALAVWLRARVPGRAAARHGLRDLVMGTLLLLLIGLCVSTVLPSGALWAWAVQPLWSRGAAHAALQLALATWLARQAARAWTRADLARLLAERDAALQARR